MTVQVRESLFLFSKLLSDNLLVDRVILVTYRHVHTTLKTLRSLLCSYSPLAALLFFLSSLVVFLSLVLCVPFS